MYHIFVFWAGGLVLQIQILSLSLSHMSII